MYTIYYRVTVAFDYYGIDYITYSVQAKHILCVTFDESC